ncbi:uncharacterized protein LOC129957454 [Argiope bruennichi]|uniref:PH domain-containing protein n=1 Tax=Argiope bruennichi TaxID=94029 RepID=A0A8T0FCV7_ARGBR|nr:uncharacterized protein LOC129957454 [Argiope bruennichi]KAF8789117.1 hypothetical protein HNY73_007087 [Argiope bruennichi]
MDLLQNTLYVFVETSTGNGKWIAADVALNTDGNVKIKFQNNGAHNIQLSENCTIQAPLDTVWSKVPPLPFRRSAKETFSVHIKKSSVTWFLSSCQEERDGWCKALNAFTNRKPPPYGEYDNWNYSAEFETKLPKPFQPRKSLTPQHRSGFYSVQEPRRNSSKLPESSRTECYSGFYSPHEPKRSLKFPDAVAPQHRSGFYSVHKPKKKTSDEPTISLVTPQEDTVAKTEPENIRCRWCYVAFGCLCNVFSSCLHHCCVNFAAAI